MATKVIVDKLVSSDDEESVEWAENARLAGVSSLVHKSSLCFSVPFVTRMQRFSSICLR